MTWFPSDCSCCSQCGQCCGSTVGVVTCRAAAGTKKKTMHSFLDMVVRLKWKVYCSCTLSLSLSLRACTYTQPGSGPCLLSTNSHQRNDAYTHFIHENENLRPYSRDVQFGPKSVDTDVIDYYYYYYYFAAALLF